MVVKIRLPDGSALHEPPYTKEEIDDFYGRVGNGPDRCAVAARSFGRSARAIFAGLAEIILPKTSREDFDYAHARRRATPMGLRTRTMGMLLRWPLAKTKPPRRN